MTNISSHPHINTVTLAGQLENVWVYSDYTYASLRIANDLVDLAFPNGSDLHGEPVLVAKGAYAACTGIIRDIPHYDTLAYLLRTMDLQHRIQAGDEQRKLWRHRVCVVPTEWRLLQQPPDPTNNVDLQGIVTFRTKDNQSTKWMDARGNRYLRVHFYDAYAKREHAKARANYASIKIPNDSPLIDWEIRDKAKLRIRGKLTRINYGETLNRILLRAKQPERIEDGDTERTRVRDASYVVPVGLAIEG